jgi:hypothetical protein
MAQPVKKFQAGTVSSVLWRNDIVVNGTSKPVLKASIQRRYCDRDGVWKSSTSFSRNEIPLAIYCLMQAYKAMVEGDGDNANDAVPVESVLD